MQQRLPAALICTLGLSLGILSGCATAEGFNAGIEFQDKTTMADVGLPSYPGAVLKHDDDDEDTDRHGNKKDKAAFGMSLWGGSFGLKLQIMKFHSDDSIDQISDFYRQAMARYGKVLDCSMSTPDDDADRESRKLSLRCDRSDRKEGKRVYKVGTDKNHFRLVSMQREGKGVDFQIVNLAVNTD